MANGYCDYSNLNAFFWDSTLTDERKRNIIAWVKTLDNDAKDMLQDMLNDTREHAYFDSTND